MAEGIGGHSPADVPRYLEGMNFPASRMEIIRHARQHHADPTMVRRLEQIPDEEYESMDDVVEEYRQLH